MDLPGCYTTSLWLFCDSCSDHNEQAVNCAQSELDADGGKVNSQGGVTRRPQCVAVVASPATVAARNGRELTVPTAKRCHFFDVASEGLWERGGVKEGRGAKDEE